MSFQYALVIAFTTNDWQVYYGFVHFKSILSSFNNLDKFCQRGFEDLSTLAKIC